MWANAQVWSCVYDVDAAVSVVRAHGSNLPAWWEINTATSSVLVNADSGG